MELKTQLARGNSCSGLAYHLDVRFTDEHGPQTGAHDCVVVSQRDAYPPVSPPLD